MDYDILINYARFDQLDAYEEYITTQMVLTNRRMFLKNFLV